MYRYLTNLFLAGVAVVALLASPAAHGGTKPSARAIIQTVFASTGVMITTCNWNLGDASINEAAAEDRSERKGSLRRMSMFIRCGTDPEI